MAETPPPIGISNTASDEALGRARILIALAPRTSWAYRVTTSGVGVGGTGVSVGSGVGVFVGAGVGVAVGSGVAVFVGATVGGLVGDGLVGAVGLWLDDGVAGRGS